MIAYLRGRVAATTAETVIIDVNGVGYEAYCSGSAFAKEKELFLKLIPCRASARKWESPFCPYSAEKRSCPPSRRPTSNV